MYMHTRIRASWRSEGGEAQLREQAHGVVLEVARAAVGAVGAAAQAQDEVEGGLLLHVVVGERAAVVELLAREDEALLVGGDPLLVLDLALDRVDGVRDLDLERDGLARQGLDEDLHPPGASLS